MTTIAWDGEILATDSQINDGNMIDQMDFKKIKECKHHIYTGSGDLYGVAALMNWHCDPSLEKPPVPEVPKDTFLLVWDRVAQVMWEYSHTGTALRVGPPYALGSGRHFARAALVCGKNAAQAVKVAIDLDCFSGGDVQYILTGASTESK